MEVGDYITYEDEHGRVEGWIIRKNENLITLKTYGKRMVAFDTHEHTPAYVYRTTE